MIYSDPIDSLMFTLDRKRTLMVLFKTPLNTKKLFLTLMNIQFMDFHQRVGLAQEG